MRFIAISLMLFSLSLSNGIAGEATPQQQLEKYLTLAAKVYPPRLDISPAERLALRKRLDAYWLPPRASAKDFLFIKRNVRFPFTISGIEGNGNAISALVAFTPDTGSLVAAAPMYFATHGRYELSRRQGEWKLVGFEEILPKQERAVGPSASIREVLSRYLELMATIYPSDGSKLPRKELFATQAKVRSLWKRGAVNPAGMTLAKSPGGFFKIYQPSAWKIQSIREAGDFARVRLEMTVGSPIQIKLHRGAFTRQVQYSLARHQGSWNLAEFEDLDAKAERKASQQATRQAEAEKRRLAVSRPETGTGREVLDAYFRQLQVYYPPGHGAVSKTPMQITDETKKFWKLDTRAARSGHARSMSFFMIFRPSGWSIDKLSENGETITARVSFAIGNEDMLRLNKDSPARSVSYLLTREGKDWFLTGYNMRP